jgi:cytoskeletal protein RodZ
MPDRPLPSDTGQARARFSDSEARAPFNDNYVILGIVFVCVLMALVLFGAGMIDERITTQPNAPVTTQSDSQAPAITQPSTQAPVTTQSDSQAPAITQPSAQAPGTTPSDSQAPAITQPSTEAPGTTPSDSQAPAITQPSTEAPGTGQDTP